MKSSSWIWSIVVIVLVAVTSYGLFLLTQGASLPEGFVYGNGHIEGRDVKLAAERGGRVVRQVQGHGAQAPGPHRGPLPGHIQGPGNVIIMFSHQY